MANDITVDSSEVRELEKVFRTTAPKQLKKSMRRALSRTRTGSRTQASKTVREKYNIQARRLKRDVILTRPNYSSFSFRLIGRKKPISLISFRGKSGPPRQTKAGVTVAVEKGQRKLIRHAFIARGANGNAQVFTRYPRRGEPSGRLPIRSLRGPSASDMVIGSDVVEHLTGYAQERFLDELQRNLRFFLGRT